MKLVKEDYRKEMDAVRAFANESLQKANDPADRVKFKELYRFRKLWLQSNPNHLCVV